MNEAPVRLENTRKAIRRNEEDLEDNRKQLAKAEGTIDFLQHVYREQHGAFAGIGAHWKGNGALRFLQRGSQGNDEAVQQVKRSLEEECERLKGERQRLRRAGEELDREYRRIEREGFEEV